MTGDGPDPGRETRSVEGLPGDAYAAIDEDGAVIEWSPQAERTFGWSGEEASGRDLLSLIAPPGEIDRYRRELASICDVNGNPSGGRLEVEACDRNGNPLPVEAAVWATPSASGCNFNILFHDLCDRRDRDEALERLAAIVDGSPDPIISTTPDGTVLSWNRAAEDLYGFTEQEMIKQSVFRIVPDESRTQMQHRLDLIGRAEPVGHHETVRVAKSGCEVEVAVTMSPIRDRHGNLLASILDRDLTESRWMATTLDVTLKTLEEALTDAQAAEARSRGFLADAAHQLRTPLAGIRAAAQSLLLGTDAVDRDRLLTDLVREASRAGRLVGSLLQIARIDEGEALIPKQGAPLGAFDRQAGRARRRPPAHAPECVSLRRSRQTSHSGTSRSRLAMPTPGPPSVTTTAGPTSTSTRPMSWSPSSPGADLPLSA